MSNLPILIVAEHDNAGLRPATLNAASAAREIAGHSGGAEVHVLVAGNGCRGAAEAAAQIDGVGKVLCADHAAYGHQLPEAVAALVVSVVTGGGGGGGGEDGGGGEESGGEPRYSHLLAPATTTGKNLMPRVAALLNVAQVSDIIEVKSADTFVRPIYAGNAMATVQSGDKVKVITVRATAFSAAASGSGTAAIEDWGFVAEQSLSEFVGEQLSESERPELTAASIVISGGRGMQSGEHFAMLERIADKLGAAIGASRAAVDAGFVANDMQVGQTGKVVAPELYIAVGISGAIQHLAGMKDSKVIVAINKDAEAPIFQIADYGLAADLFTALPELEAAL